MQEWTSALGAKPFLHGDKITLPDLYVFGVLRAIDSRAPGSQRDQGQNARLASWYGRMKGRSSCEQLETAWRKQVYSKCFTILVIVVH